MSKRPPGPRLPTDEELLRQLAATPSGKRVIKAAMRAGANQAGKAVQTIGQIGKSAASNPNSLLNFNFQSHHVQPSTPEVVVTALGEGELLLVTGVGGSLPGGSIFMGRMTIPSDEMYLVPRKFFTPVPEGSFWAEQTKGWGFVPSHVLCTRVDGGGISGMEDWDGYAFHVKQFAKALSWQAYVGMGFGMMNAASIQHISLTPPQSVDEININLLVEPGPEKG